VKPHNEERFRTLRLSLSWARWSVIEQAEALHEAKKHADASANANVSDLTWRNCNTLRCEGIQRLVAVLDESPR